MPSNLLNVDTAFPNLRGEQSTDEKFRMVSDYLYMLREQLQYSMANLGRENFNDNSFDDIAHNLENNEDLRSFMYELLILGQEKHFERTNPTIDLAATFGFIRNEEGRAVIHNRMFEIKITNYFISKNMILPH